METSVRTIQSATDPHEDGPSRRRRRHVLALRCAPRHPPPLAGCTSQCGCRAWRDIVNDYHWLPLERYFPRRAFPGLFGNKTGCRSDTSFFAPPTAYGARAPSTRTRRYYTNPVMASSSSLRMIIHHIMVHIMSATQRPYDVLPSQIRV